MVVSLKSGRSQSSRMQWMIVRCQRNRFLFGALLRRKALRSVPHASRSVLPDYNLTFLQPLLPCVRQNKKPRQSCGCLKQECSDCADLGMAVHKQHLDLQLVAPDETMTSEVTGVMRRRKNRGRANHTQICITARPCPEVGCNPPSKSSASSLPEVAPGVRCRCWVVRGPP